MKIMSVKMSLGILFGFLAGVAASGVSSAFAASDADVPEALSTKTFDVAIFEIRQKLTPGRFLSEKFSGSYARTFTMSDGSERQIELTPMVHKDKQVVQFKDNQGTTYMGLNGTTLNGTLLVQVLDSAASKERLKAEGWIVQ